MSAPLDNHSPQTWVPGWVHQLGMPVWVTSQRGTITYWNRHAESLLGKSASDCVGRPCHEVISGRHPDGTRFCQPHCEVRKLAAAESPIEPIQLQVGNHIARVVVISARGPNPHEFALVHCALGDERVERISGFLEQVLERTPNDSEKPNLELRSLLTPRETEVLSLLAQDVSLEQIADRLGVSYATVRNHTQHIREKLGVHSTLEAVVLFLMEDQ